MPSFPRGPSLSHSRNFQVRDNDGPVWPIQIKAGVFDALRVNAEWYVGRRQRELEMGFPELEA